MALTTVNDSVNHHEIYYLINLINTVILTQPVYFFVSCHQKLVFLMSLTVFLIDSACINILSPYIHFICDTHIIG